jgi:hypothetical protein
VAKPPILRTKSVTTKVTEAEYARVEELASASGVNLSEWVRGRLLDTSGSSDDTNVLLGELLALRTILINVLFSVSEGKPLTAEQMQALIVRADKDKMRRVLETLGDTRLTAPPEAGEE